MSVVSLHPRDIVFTFKDSCNCCFFCCKKAYTKYDNVYINSQGKLEEYNYSKAKENIERAFERAKEHLFITLKYKLSLIDRSIEDFHEKAISIVDSMDTLGKININHIDAINELMVVFLKAKKGDN